MRKLLFVCFLILLSLSQISSSNEYVFDDVASGIRSLTPTVSEKRSNRLTVWILGASTNYELDPFLITAIIRRESNFMSGVETGQIRGSRGEIGLMQSHGVSLRHRPTGCPRHLLVFDSLTKRLSINESARCQIYTGSAFLSWVRSYCGGTKSRWVASYGMSRCATEREAPHMISVKRAHRYYLRAGGTNW